MEPTVDTTLSRPDIGQVVYEVMQDSITMGFIGLSVMPLFGVPEFSGVYPVMPKEALFNIHDTKRSQTGAYNQVDENFEEGFYKTSENGLSARIDDRMAKIYATKFDYESVVAKLLLQKILRAHEYRVKEKIFNTTNFTAHNAGTAWSNIAADMADDVDTGKASLRGNGIEPDTLILPWTVLAYARKNTALKSQVYQLFPDATKSGRVTIEHLKTVFDVPKVLVAGALYNSAKKGKNAVLAELWGSRYAMLCKTANPGDDITAPSIGRTILWNEGRTDEMIIAEEYIDNHTRGKMLRVRHDSSETFLTSYDENQAVKSEISKACGYLIDMTAAT